MQLKFQPKNMQLSSSLEKLIERKALKLRKMLPTFRSEDLSLHAHLEQLSRGKQFQSELILSMPQKVIRVEDIEETAVTSVVRAFDELLRRVKKFKSQLNRERYHHRPRSASADLSAVSQPMEREIERHLDTVDNFVRRELYHRALAGDFQPGSLRPQAVVDEVFLEVTGRVATRPKEAAVRPWIFKVAREVIARRISGHAWRSDQEVGSARQQTSGDHDGLDLYQPQETLQLEQLLWDPSAGPEEPLPGDEGQAGQEHLQEAIAALPSSLRESFVLFVLEGFGSEEVAQITARDVEKVREDIERIRQQLRRWRTRPSRP